MAEAVEGMVRRMVPECAYRRQRPVPFLFLIAWLSRFGIAACPSDALALTNKLVVNGQDFPPHVEFVRLKGKYVMAIM